MIKNILFGLLLACGLFMACSDDDAPSPSYAERDWWTPVYDPNADELDQLIYDIYEESGIRFFYNDTLGSEIRYDGGEPYTYYATYRMGYSFTSAGTTSANYYLSYDREVLKDFIDYYFLIVDPVLNSTDFSYKRFFIVDTVFKSKGNAEVLSYWNDVANSTVVVSMTDVTKQHFNTLTEEMRKQLMFAVLFNQVYDLFGGTQAKNHEDLQAFFDVSRNCVEWPVEFKGTPYYKGFKLTSTNPEHLFPDGSKITDYDNLPFRYVWLTVRGVSATYYNIIDENTDFKDYLTLIFENMDDEIRAMYGHQELVMEKYEILVDVLKKHSLEKFFAYGKKLAED